MINEGLQCLICCSVKTTTNTDSKEDLFNEERKTGVSLLSQNLEAIFVLRMLLHVPIVQLENQLKEFGSDPESWIRLCDECTQLVKRAKALDEEIRKIEKQFSLVQKQIIEKIKCLVEPEDKQISDSNLLTFEEKIRSFVKIHDYSDKFTGSDKNESGRFREGDERANYLAGQQNYSTSKISLDEKWVKEEIKFEVESIPSPSSPSSPLESEVSLNYSPEPSEEEEEEASAEEEDDDDKDFKIKTKSKQKTKSINKPRKRKFEICHCSHCGKQFTNRPTMLQHERSVHLKTFRIKCPICQKAFPANRNKNFHMLSIHKDDPLTLKLQEEKGIFLKKCTVAGCYFPFLNEDQEIKHMTQIHGGTEEIIEKKYTFKCEQCNKGFWLKSKLKIHEQSHQPKDSRKLFNCSHCEKRYKTRSALAKHVKFIHFKEFTIFCPICEKGLYSNQKKSIHMLTVHKDDPLTMKLKEEKGFFHGRCSMVGCKTIFLTKEDEDKHMKKFHEGDDKAVKEIWKKDDGDKRSKVNKDGQVLCGECGKWYSKWTTWTKHFWMVHKSAGDVVCPGEKCEKTFKVDKEGLKGFKGHFEEVHETKTIVCKVCGKEMLNRKLLWIHMGQHYTAKKNVERKWICDICGVERKTYGNLHSHKKHMHKVNMKGEPLNLEEENFRKKVKKESKKVLCNLCGKEYCEKKSLEKHVKLVHEKEFSFSCHLCGIGFPHRQGFYTHLLRMHKDDPVAKKLETEEGLRLIKCEVVGCQRICLKQDEMDRHMVSGHKGGTEKEAKKFGCKVCGKEFFVRAKLVYHEKVHEKDRNNGKALKCESCGKGFDTRHYLRCHQRRVHKF